MNELIDTAADAIVVLLFGLAIAACAGCKHITVETPEWKASYFAACQANDLKGLKVKAGENVALELESVQSGIDPAVREAMKSAAAALAAASRACAACATGGASEAAIAAGECADGACNPTR